MSTNNYTSFFITRCLFDATLPLEQVTDGPYDFITFLAVIQKLQFDILPIIWQSARGPIARGGTASIYEAFINLHTSFAFKCVGNGREEGRAESIIRALISEVIVLGHASIRKHPNIVELQGICWDVVSDDKVWPVLVFEKSQYGDLSNFATLPIGRELCIAERLKLCIDVGIAISDLHFNNIIHGDIKPQNILIFKDDADAYTSRVTDFGYSTQFANEDDLISMPVSQPWSAPEYYNRRYRPAQARKMEVFSFGILCLWFLFEKYLSGITPPPQEAQRYFQGKEERYLSQGILMDLKHRDELVVFSQQLIMAEKDLDDERKQVLKGFFYASLACNPNNREASLEQLLSRLISSQQDCIPLLQLHSPNTTQRTQPQVLRLENNGLQVQNCSFEIVLSIDSLYQSDYRVRQYIRRLLEKRILAVRSDSYLEYMDGNLVFQLALCYKIGFGGYRDEPKSLEMLHQSGKTGRELNEIIDRIKLVESDGKKYAGTTYTSLLTLGHISSIDFADQYRKSCKLKEAEVEIRREIRDIEHCVGKESYVWMINTSILSTLCQAHMRWKEAEELEVQVMEIRKRVLGLEHPSTLASMANLAVTYRNQEQWKEAEELEVQVTEIRKRVLGSEHPDTLASMANLAWTYSNRGRWKNAAELEVQALETRKRMLGEEHPLTLTSCLSLASTYWYQGRLEDAKELEEKVRKLKSVFRDDQLLRLTSIADLALTLKSRDSNERLSY